MATLPIKTYRFEGGGSIVIDSNRVKTTALLKRTGLDLDLVALVRYASYVNAGVSELTLKCVPGRSVKSQLWALTHQDSVLMSNTLCKLNASYTIFITSVFKSKTKGDDPDIVDGVHFDKVIMLDGAMPTSRSLDGTPDQWASQEWKEEIEYEGKHGYCYYLFTDEQTKGVQPDQYPWLPENVSRYVFD